MAAGSRFYTERMGKKDSWRAKNPFEDEAFAGDPFVDELMDALFSPEGELADEVCEVVSNALQSADIDAKNRRIVWTDGKRLSFTESVQRIGAEHPYPIELIETALIFWLESYAPEHYTQAQLDELDRLAEDWLLDLERQAGAMHKK